MTKNNFSGREKELKRLHEFLGKKTASFIVIKGRRRIGKSRLVEEFSKEFKHYFKFEGPAPEKEITAEYQREVFSQQIAQQFKTAKAIYSDWSDAFIAIKERIPKEGRTLLFFDELSWMGSEDPGFLGKIKMFWDNQLSRNNKLIFIVCSSASAWIEKNLLSTTGFVGRISFTLTLEELPLCDCNSFWPETISSFEKLKALSITGGIPRYLEEINPAFSAEENIKRLCFKKGGLLTKEFKQIFSDLVLRNSSFYKKIIKSLANGAKEYNQIESEICKGTDRKHLGRISEYLWELEEAGFVSRDYSWDLKTERDLKLSKYRLKDNYLRFYLKYIEKNLLRINRDLFLEKSLTALPEWATMMGFQFENLVLNNRKRLHEILRISPQEIITENPFFRKQTVRHAGCQIDYLVQTSFGSLYICEIKFSKHSINSSAISEVKGKITDLQPPKGFSCRPVLIHVNGVDEDVIDSNFFAHIVDFADFFKQ